MLIQLTAVIIIAYLLKRFGIMAKMFRPGGPLFAVGYNLYAKTRVGNYLNSRDLRKTRQLFPDGHSITELKEYDGFSVLPIPYLKDNYAYLITDSTSKLAVVVDPGDADAVQRVIEQHPDIRLSAILTTHKHWDHSGGNRKLKSLYPNLPVYGSKEDHVPGATHKVRDGESVEIGSLKFTAVFTPGHTVGHTVYYLDRAGTNSPSCVFTGDLLFLSGIGRMFEGPHSLMLRSLDKVCQFPDDTLIWPGHEYALESLRFSSHIELHNEDAKRKLYWVQEQRRERRITSPSTLGEEKLYNPFLRTSQDSILQQVDSAHQTAADRDGLRARALLYLRQSKDAFSYKL